MYFVMICHVSRNTFLITRKFDIAGKMTKQQSISLFHCHAKFLFGYNSIVTYLITHIVFSRLEIYFLYAIIEPRYLKLLPHTAIPPQWEVCQCTSQQCAKCNRILIFIATIHVNLWSTNFIPWYNSSLHQGPLMARGQQTH